MPKIRHLALATQQPDTTAAFYRDVFGFVQVSRSANAIFLADGTLNLAIIKFREDQLGKGMDYVGMHHFGVLVDDVPRWSRRMESLGVKCFMEPPPGDGDFNYEYKFRGPDGVVFDLSSHPWGGTPTLVDAASSPKIKTSGGSAMAKIRHLAIATNDPDATAEFYKRAFDFVELERRDNPLATGVFLTDGTLNLAILKFKTDQLGKGMDYVGLHHFGILVDDVATFRGRLESMGVSCFMEPPPGDTSSNFEYKFRGPDGVVFDIAQHPWGGTSHEDVAPAHAAGQVDTALHAK